MPRDAKPKPGGRPWLRRCRVAFRWCRIAVWLLLLTLICAALYVTEVGIPEFAKERIKTGLRAQGVELDFERARFRWFQGIQADLITLGRSGVPGTITAAEATVDLDQKSLSRREWRIEAINVRDAAMRLVPSLTNLHPIEVDGVQLKISFPATNVVVLDRFRGRLRQGTFSVFVGVTNIWSLTNLIARPSTPKPPGPLSLTNQVNRLAEWIDRFDIDSSSRVHVSVAGDAARPEGVVGSVRLTVPKIDTQWGHATNLVVTASIRDLFTDVADSGVDLNISARRAATPWGEGERVSVKGRVHPADQDMRLWEARLEVRATNAVTRWATARSITLRTEALLDTLNPVPPRASGDLDVAGVETEWFSLGSGRIHFDRAAGTNDWSGATNHPELGLWTNALPHRLRFTAALTNIVTPKLAIPSARISAAWKAPLLAVEDLDVQMATGPLRARASVDVATRLAEWTAKTDFDLHEASPLLLPESRRWLEKFTWNSPPDVSASGSVLLPACTNTAPDWRADVQPGLRISGRFGVTNGAYRGLPVDAASGTFNYTNLLWLLPDTRLTRPEGTVDLAFSSTDKGAKQTFKFVSSIDPQILRPLFPTNANRVFDLFEFRGMPVIAADFHWFKDAPEKSVAAAHVVLRDTSFRTQWVDRVEATVAFTNGYIQARDVKVARGTNWARGEWLGFDLGTSVLTISNGAARFELEPFLRGIGPRTWKTMEPYRFLDTPGATINGWLNTRDSDEVDLRFGIDAGRFEWNRYSFDTLAGDARWMGRTLVLTNMAGRGYGTGAMNGAAFFEFADQGRTDFRFALDYADVDLQKFMQGIKATNRLEGLLTGNLTITDGSEWRPTGWNGHGWARLTNGFIWEYPIFGLLSPVLDGISPGAGKDRARSATATFILTNSVAWTDDLELRAAAMRLNYRGSVDFQQRVNARVDAVLLRDTPLLGPLLSFALSPFTRLFEFEITGTLQDPVQKAAYIPGFLMKILTPFHTLKQLLPEPEKKPAPEP